MKASMIRKSLSDQHRAAAVAEAAVDASLEVASEDGALELSDQNRHAIRVRHRASMSLNRGW